MGATETRALALVTVLVGGCSTTNVTNIYETSADAGDAAIPTSDAGDGPMPTQEAATHEAGDPTDAGAGEESCAQLDAACASDWSCGIVSDGCGSSVTCQPSGSNTCDAFGVTLPCGGAGIPNICGGCVYAPNAPVNPSDCAGLPQGKGGPNIWFCGYPINDAGQPWSDAGPYGRDAGPPVDPSSPYGPTSASGAGDCWPAYGGGNLGDFGVSVYCCAGTGQ